MYLNIFNGVLNEKLLDKTNADEVFNKEVFDNLADAFSDFKPIFTIVKTEADFDNLVVCDQLKYIKNETFTKQVGEIKYSIGNYDKTFFIMIEKDNNAFIIKSNKNKVELIKQENDVIKSKLRLDKYGNLLTIGNDFYINENEKTK
ncbi:MAG: hypothetical protein K6F08_01850 [bacterium]|nr:hypothetical protein [bacterium]